MSSHHPEEKTTADLETTLSSQPSEPPAQAEPVLGKDSAASPLLRELAGEVAASADWELKQLLAQLEAMLQAQQFQLEQYRRYRDEAEAETEALKAAQASRIGRLEQQLGQQRDRLAQLENDLASSQTAQIPLQVQRNEAWAQTERLQSQLSQRRGQVEQLRQQLDLAEATLAEQQQLSDGQARQLLSLGDELERSRREIAALETRLAHQNVLKEELREQSEQERQARHQGRDRQLQLDQALTQLKTQLLHQGEQLQASSQEGQQWRRLAQTQAQQLRGIVQWAAAAADIPADLMACLAPVLESASSLEQPITSEFPTQPSLHPPGEPSPSQGSAPQPDILRMMPTPEAPTVQPSPEVESIESSLGKVASRVLAFPPQGRRGQGHSLPVRSDPAEQPMEAHPSTNPVAEPSAVEPAAEPTPNPEPAAAPPPLDSPPAPASPAEARPEAPLPVDLPRFPTGPER